MLNSPIYTSQTLQTNEKENENLENLVKWYEILKLEMENGKFWNWYEKWNLENNYCIAMRNFIQKFLFSPKNYIAK